MKKIIDIPEEIKPILEQKAKEEKRSLKNFIENILVKLAKKIRLGESQQSL